jgi:hypothetical protein
MLIKSPSTHVPPKAAKAIKSRGKLSFENVLLRDFVKEIVHPTSYDFNAHVDYLRGFAKYHN